jgi:hypothetical protein
MLVDLTKKQILDDPMKEETTVGPIGVDVLEMEK